MNIPEIALISAAAYILIINLAAVIAVISDKKKAKRSGARRIPEKTLFIIAALGGAPAMYITMRKIRHKTLHKRFMIGIPAIMICHLLIICGILYFLFIRN